MKLECACCEEDLEGDYVPRHRPFGSKGPLVCEDCVDHYWGEELEGTAVRRLRAP